MTLKSFERRLLELVFHTSAVLTVPYVAYCLGLSLQEAEKKLHLLVKMGVLDVESLSNGILHFRLASSVGGQPQRPFLEESLGIPFPVFPEKARRWYVLIAATCMLMGMIAVGSYLMGMRHKPSATPSGSMSLGQGLERAKFAGTSAYPLAVKGAQFCEVVIPLEELLRQGNVDFQPIREGKRGETSALKVESDREMSIRLRCQPRKGGEEDKYSIMSSKRRKDMTKLKRKLQKTFRQREARMAQ